jgi:hypothetical protein
MHIGAFDAEMLPPLLALYRSRGFQFLTLQEAERDPLYVTDTDLNLPPGANTLERAMAERQCRFRRILFLPCGLTLYVVDDIK